MRLWYCPCVRRYVLRYAVRFRNGDVAQAVCARDDGSYELVADMLVGAVYIANLPLEHRS